MGFEHKREEKPPSNAARAWGSLTEDEKTRTATVCALGEELPPDIVDRLLPFGMAITFNIGEGGTRRAPFFATKTFVDYLEEIGELDPADVEG